MSEKTLIEQAFETFDVDLLNKALENKDDLNAVDNTGSPIWEDFLYDYTVFNDEKYRLSWVEKKKRIIDFLTIAVKNGLDLSTLVDEVSGRKFSPFYSVVRFCCNHDLNFLQLLIDLGVNLNGIVGDCCTTLEDLEDDIF